MLMMALFPLVMLAGLIHGVFLLAPLLVLAFVLWMAALVLNKAGFSGWWCLAILVPTLAIILLWIFAFAEWPRRSRVQILPPNPRGRINRPWL